MTRLGFCLLSLFSLVSAEASLVNRNVVQVLDTFKSYVRQTFQIELENQGDEASNVYKFLVPADKHESLAFIESRDVSSMGDLDITVSESPSLEYIAYDISLSAPLVPGDATQFGVILAFSDDTRPLPAKGEQNDEQFMYYDGARNYVSVYPTVEEVTQFAMLGEKYEFLDNFEEQVALNPTGILEFGPYHDVPALSAYPLKIRYENPTPQLTIPNLHRTVWVSHWGNSVSVDDAYDIKNTGTQLDGPFSRSKFMQSRMGNSLNTASIRALRIPLPEGHREEYYTDLVGNVSTSQVQSGVIDILPRYPIMGGWFYNFTIGYAADLGRFVHNPSFSNYALQVSLVSGPDFASYSKVTTKVVLPEGASNVEVISPIPYENLDEYTTYSYLDLFGRPTVEITYSNLVSEMFDQKLYVTYNYGVISALQKPLAYIVAIFALLVSGKLAKRLI